MSDFAFFSHDEVSQSTSGNVDERWSARRTAMFCALTCGAFWVVAIYGAIKLF